MYTNGHLRKRKIYSIVSRLKLTICRMIYWSPTKCPTFFILAMRKT